jgi:4-hydroxy-4-methyl-2-oxoglutarate aldolase
VELAVSKVLDSAVARLAALDVCTVSDALDALGLPGAVAGINPMWQGARLAGKVTTMRLRVAPGERAERHLGAAAIERSRTGEVIVVQQPESEELVSAAWGGVLSRAAHHKQLAGVIVDGNCRDVDEVRELGFAVHARAAVPFTARRRYVEDAVGATIHIAGVDVAQGDYAVADASGVVFVSAQVVEDVLRVAERLWAKEQLMVADVASGAAVSVVLGTNYEEMLDVT